MKYKYIERPSNKDDSLWLWDTYKSLLKETIVKQWGWDESFQYNGFHSNFDLEKYQIVEINGQRVAAYYLVENNDSLHIKMLLVIASHQRLGIGSGIIKKIKETGSLLGKSVKLSVIESNPALLFYQKLDFSILGTKDGCHNLQWSP